MFVPPYHWYHMHMNSGAVENRQLRIRAPRPGANPSADPNRAIPFHMQDPWIRQKFEEELAKRGLTSLMPKGPTRTRTTSGMPGGWRRTREPLHNSLTPSVVAEVPPSSILPPWGGGQNGGVSGRDRRGVSSLCARVGAETTLELM